MKSSCNFCTLFVFTFLAFVVSSCVFAQNNKRNWIEEYFGEDNRRYHDMSQRTMMKAQWNGKATRFSIQPILDNTEFRKTLGFSEDQISQLDFMTSKNGSLGHWYQSKAKNDPVLKQKLAEMLGFLETRRTSGFSDEQRERYNELQADTTAYYFEENQKDLERILTPQQLKSVHEIEIAMLSEIGIVNPGMFDALDLTDEQRANMKGVKEEMEKEFNTLVEDTVKMQNNFKDVYYDVLKNESLETYSAFDKAYAEAAKNPQIREKIEKLRSTNMEKGRKFLDRFKIKMYDYLTDEQLEKMQNLIESTPEIYLDGLRKRREAAQKSGNWQPGEYSWQPGNPIPEEYIKKRLPGRFPRTK